MAYYNEFIESPSNQRRKWIALGVVVLVYLLFFLVFTLLGLKHMEPLPPEYGIELDMSGGGGGGSQASAQPAPQSEPENVAPAKTAKVTNSAKVSTQRLEETPKVVAENTRQTNEKIENSNPEPTVNENALFKKRTNSNQFGTGTGSGTGSGSGTGVGSGSGSGGGNGAGIGKGEGDFWLDGRPVIHKEYPHAPKNTQGYVIVEFLADKNGKVVYAKAGARGTTINDAALWAECERAAKASTFKSKAEAIGEDKGTIRYKFVL